MRKSIIMRIAIAVESAPPKLQEKVNRERTEGRYFQIRIHLQEYFGQQLLAVETVADM